MANSPVFSGISVQFSQVRSGRESTFPCAGEQKGITPGPPGVPRQAEGDAAGRSRMPAAAITASRNTAASSKKPWA